MPRIVVMDRELHEPLTVVEIRADLMPENRRGHRHLFLPLNIPVMGRREISKGPPPHHGDLPDTHTLIRLEPIYTSEPGSSKRVVVFWYAYADDPEIALTLRSVFLPGQIHEVRRLEEQARWETIFKFARGI